MNNLLTLYYTASRGYIVDISVYFYHTGVIGLAVFIVNEAVVFNVKTVFS